MVFGIYSVFGYLDPEGHTLVIQVYKSYIRWGPKYGNNTYFGPLGSLVEIRATVNIMHSRPC